MTKEAFLSRMAASQAKAKAAAEKRREARLASSSGQGEASSDFLRRFMETKTDIASCIDSVANIQPTTDDKQQSEPCKLLDDIGLRIVDLQNSLNESTLALSPFAVEQAHQELKYAMPCNCRCCPECEARMYGMTGPYPGYAQQPSSQAFNGSRPFVRYQPPVPPRPHRRSHHPHPQFGHYQVWEPSSNSSSSAASSGRPFAVPGRRWGDGRRRAFSYLPTSRQQEVYSNLYGRASDDEVNDHRDEIERSLNEMLNGMNSEVGLKALDMVKNYVNYVGMSASTMHQCMPSMAAGTSGYNEAFDHCSMTSTRFPSGMPPTSSRPLGSAGSDSTGSCPSLPASIVELDDAITDQQPDSTSDQADDETAHNEEHNNTLT